MPKLTVYIEENGKVVLYTTISKARYYYITIPKALIDKGMLRHGQPVKVTIQPLEQ